MEVNLPVPYKSQWDDDARGTANDCGPSSIAMIYNFYEKDAGVTTDFVFQKTGAGQGLITISQMQQAIQALGYDSQFKTNCTIAELKSYLDKGIPVIALVHYGSLNSVQDKVYKSGHFFVVVGYRDDGYFVNDPNFKDHLRQDGDHHFFTKAEFEKAWADCYLDKNPVNSLLIIPQKTTVSFTPKTFYAATRNVIATPDKGINIRTVPSVQGMTIVRVLEKGASFAVEGFVEGEAYMGNSLWWKLKGEDLYAWTGATNFVPSIPAVTVPAEGTPAENPEALKLRVQALEDELRRVGKNYQDLNLFTEDLKKQKTALEEKLAEFGNQNFDAVKTANESLSLQNKELLRKNKELADMRDDAYIKAFTGWKLFEVPMGIKGTTAALSLIGKMLTLSNTKRYVVGWKEGATLHRVNEETPAIHAQDATADVLQPSA